MTVVLQASPMGVFRAPAGCNLVSRPTKDLFPVQDRNVDRPTTGLCRLAGRGDGGPLPYRVRGNPRSILEVPGSGQREVTILARV
jgi:hypothetical protein